MRRILLVLVVAAVMVVMAAPAMAQSGKTPNPNATEGLLRAEQQSGGKSKGPLPGTGGLPIAPVAAAMLLGTGVVALAVIRRR